MDCKKSIRTARVYADAAGDGGDGYRVLVDRLWPRGESKAEFHYDFWAKDVAPSTELRQWYHMDPAGRWEEFERRYDAELDANPAVKELMKLIAPYPTVTLLYGSHDQMHNNAVVLARYLQAHCGAD